MIGKLRTTNKATKNFIEFLGDSFSNLLCQITINHI